MWGHSQIEKDKRTIELSIYLIDYCGRIVDNWVQDNLMR